MPRNAVPNFWQSYLPAGDNDVAPQNVEHGSVRLDQARSMACSMRGPGERVKSFSWSWSRARQPWRHPNREGLAVWKTSGVHRGSESPLLRWVQGERRLSAHGVLGSRNAPQREVQRRYVAMALDGPQLRELLEVADCAITRRVSNRETASEFPFGKVGAVLPHTPCESSEATMGEQLAGTIKAPRPC